MENLSELPAVVHEKLALLGGGFGSVAIHEGIPGVPLEGTGEIQIPGWAQGLMLRITSVEGPLHGVATLHDQFWHALGEEPLRGAETLLGFTVAGAGVLRISLPPGLKVRVTDFELTPFPMRARFDLTAMRARKRRFLTLRLDLTNKCNLRCRMCPLSFDEVFFQQKDYVSIEEFARIAEGVLPFAGHVALSAGFEPLLHPQFRELLALLRRYEVPYVELTTNGTLLTRPLMESLVDAGVNCVIFSVDGATRETYEHVRRGADFGRFMRSLEVFRSVRRERASRRPVLAFNMVLMRSNVDELADVIRLGSRYGLGRMNTVLLVPHVGLGVEDELLQLDRERANLAFARARATAQELGIEAQIPPDFDCSTPQPLVERVDGFQGMTLATEWGKGATVDFEPPAVPEDADAALPTDDTPLAPNDEPIPEWYPTDNAGPTMIRAGSASLGHPPMDGDGFIADTVCSYPWNMAVLRPDRTVVPCCQWVDPEIMGDLKTQTWDEVWNSSAYQKLRVELQARRLRPACLHCPERQRI